MNVGERGVGDEWPIEREILKRVSCCLLAEQTLKRQVS
jgi:hypothetical protein